MRKANADAVTVTKNELNFRPVSFWKKLWLQRQLMLMSVPMLLYIFLFNYFPLWGWITAFMNYNPAKPLFENPWVGMRWIS